MRILMIDRSSITDRRIVLEAQSLMERGHSVELIASSSESSSAWAEVKGLVVRRFRDTAFGDTSAILRRRDRLRPLLGRRLSLLASVVSMPSEGTQFLSGANSLRRWQQFALRSLLGFVGGEHSFSRTFQLLVAAWRSRQSNVFVADEWEQQVLDAATGPYDVIHVHDLPTLGLGVHLKSIKNAKLVYDAHELYCYLPGMSPEAQENLKSLEASLIKNTDLVVLINEEQANKMCEDYGPFRYVCLTNATKPEGVSSIRANLIREKLKISSDDRILIFQGYVSRERNIDTLIEGLALTQTKPHVVFLSWGPEIEGLKSLASALGVGERVHFLPPVPWDEVISWAESADVGVMPYQPTNLNTAISSPNKMYEFIMARTPMIGSSELVNVRRTIDENGFGVTRPLRAAQDYASAIDEILDPKNSRWVAARDALEQKWRQFTWDEASRDFLACYKELEVV